MRSFTLGLIGLVAVTAATAARAEGDSNGVVEVRAQRLMMPGRSDSIAAAFERDPRVSLNRQGGTDVQADISIRGSSFSEAGLLVEGMALRHPQTEHFHAELPIPASVFEDPEVVTGLDQVQRSTVHPAGGIALDVRDPASGGYVDLGVSEHGGSWQSGLLESLRLPSGDGAVGISGFGYHEEASALDYPDNELKRVGGGAALKTRHGEWSSDWIVGASRKEFGARGYYGVNPDWAALEELEDTILLGTVRQGDLDGAYRRVTGLWRSTRDEYRLFIDPDAPFHNMHRSRMTGVAMDGRERVDDAWAVLWRAAYAYEGVDGNNLGDHDRERLTALVLPGWDHGRLHLSAGAMGESFSDGDAVVLPQAGAVWRVTDRQELFAAYTEAMHEPSYTELNYESPGSLGNTGLEKGRSRKSELGWRLQPRHRRAASVSVFHRETEHMVDWIKPTEDAARWTATDLGAIDTWGVECSGSRRLGEQFAVRAAYTWLEKDHDWDVYGSRYVLDYPKHRLSVDVDWMFAEDWRLTVGQTYRYHSETVAREEDATGANGRLALQWYAGTPDGLVVRAGVDNVWNDSFGSYVDLPAPDRRGWIAASWRFQ